MIKVGPMAKNHALLLLRKKLINQFDESSAIELLKILDNMPLAIVQAVAYINKEAPQRTVLGYFINFRQSDENRESLLNRDAADLYRDNGASNSVITIWQISFEHIRKERPSAARLLSLMSFF